MEQFCDPDSGKVLGFLPPDYTDQIKNESARLELRQWREARQATLLAKGVQPLRAAIGDLPTFISARKDFSNPVVTIGDPKELDQDGKKSITQAIEAFVPWKKGPFNLFGNEIDAEWRSDLKWERLRSHTNLNGKTVADIGCHNGYFMLRMLEENPAQIIGIEPVSKHWYGFQLFQRFVQDPRLYFELLGVEHMHLWEDHFDVVYCLGILYHHTDPIGLLRKINTSMKTGGELVIDCQGIPGDEDICLFPKGRYAKARGIWWLPTLNALKNWLTRSRFRNIQVIHAAPLDQEEQRSSAQAPIDSLGEFLDPNDSSRTIEGYPAPWRFYIKCLK